MKYEIKDLKSLNFYKGADSWILKFYLNSYNSYLDSCDSYFNNVYYKRFIDREKTINSNLTFIYNCVSYCEDYLTKLVSLGYVNDDNKDFVFSNISKLRQLSLKTDMGNLYFFIDNGGVVNFHDEIVDYDCNILKEELFLELGFNIYDNFLKQGYSYYLENRQENDFSLEGVVDVDECVKRGLTFFTFGLASFSALNISDQKIAQGRYVSKFFSDKRGPYYSYKQEAMEVVSLFGCNFFDVGNDKNLSLYNMSVLGMKENAFSFLVSKFRSNGMERDLFRMFFDLGVISDNFIKTNGSHSNSLCQNCVLDYVEICNNINSVNDKKK